MIRIGPAGLGGVNEAVKNLEFFHSKKINACEIAFTYSVYISNKEAVLIGEEAKKMDVKLSIHCPYFINLNSNEKAKVEASKRRILQSCERGHYLKAEKIVFHPGFFGKISKEESYENIKNAILDIQKVIHENKWKVSLAPETMGKINVFGSYDEILSLVKDTKCGFCVDFAHLKARNNGKIDYEEVFDKLKNFKELHCHFSGIEYGEKGEKNHKLTPVEEIKKLASEILKRKHDITIINESPSPIEDALTTRRVFENLGYKL